MSVTELTVAAPTQHGGTQVEPLKTETLSAPERHAAREARYRKFLTVLGFSSPILLLIVWQSLTSFGVISERVTSSPLGVLGAFAHLWESGRRIPDTLISLHRASLGLLIGFVLGTAFGMIVASSRLLNAVFDGPTRMINALPFPVVLPIFIMLFGLGEAPKIAFIAFITSTPAYVNTHAGVLAVDRKNLEVARTLGLGRAATLTQVVFPSALPSILVGLRYALTYAVFGLIVSEQLGSSNGLGFLLNDALLYVKFDQLMAIAVIYAFFGVAANLIARALERLLVPWAYTRKDAQ